MCIRDSAGTVKRQKVQGIGSTAEHALPQPVLRVGFVWDFIDLLLSCLLYTSAPLSEPLPNLHRVGGGLFLFQ